MVTPVDGFTRELEILINSHSKESGSNTPDFVLAQFLGDCLMALDHAVRWREGWYGRTVSLTEGSVITCRAEGSPEVARLTADPTPASTGSVEQRVYEHLRYLGTRIGPTSPTRECGETVILLTDALHEMRRLTAERDAALARVNELENKCVLLRRRLEGESEPELRARVRELETAGEPVAWIAKQENDDGGFQRCLGWHRDTVTRGIDKDRSANPITVSPLYAAPQQERVVRLPERIVHWWSRGEVERALTAAGVRWEVGE